MNILPALLIMTAWSGVPPQLPVARAVLAVQAIEAVAQITPHALGRRQVVVPTTSFSLQTRFACAGSAVPTLLSIGIADTLYRHVPLDNERFRLAEVEVPAKQIAPVNVGSFCVAGRASKGDNLLLPGVASAQISLRCDLNTRSAVKVTSVPLPLRLICVPEPDQDEPAAVDSLPR